MQMRLESTVPCFLSWYLFAACPQRVDGGLMTGVDRVVSYRRCLARFPQKPPHTRLRARWGGQHYN